MHITLTKAIKNTFTYQLPIFHTFTYVGTELESTHLKAYPRRLTYLMNEKFRFEAAFKVHLINAFNLLY
jgi:hypothetical protein